MRYVFGILAAVALMTSAHSAEFAERRTKAAAEFHDGILVLHADSVLSASADGFHQDPFFYYFTGLENTVGAVLAIDGKSNESWLFLPSHPPFLRDGLQPEVKPGSDAEARLALQHVVDWSEMKGFFASHAAQKIPLYFASGFSHFAELPADLLSVQSPQAPTWLQVILQKWPSFDAQDAIEADSRSDGPCKAMRR